MSTSAIDRSANSIHDTAIIRGDVIIGTGNTIGAGVLIVGPVTIGDENWIGAGVVIGAPPEVRDVELPFDANAPVGGNGIVMGNRNVLREFAQIHHGWKTVTTLGNDIYMMNQTYVAHDCTIEDRSTLASSVLLAGHVTIGERSNLGMGTTVHQGRAIGALAMVGMGSVVTRDLPPFAKAYGSPARVRGANSVGMQRAGIPEDLIEAARKAYSATPVTIAPLEKAMQNSSFSRYFESWAGRN